MDFNRFVEQPCLLKLMDVYSSAVQ